VGVKSFDRKFGKELLCELPESPAVYLFKDKAGTVLYAGKAKNVRRRLRSYRNASRRKAHRKMRQLVREASSLEVVLQSDERQALLAENELIRRLRPRYNVDGAYSFLYPSIGVGERGHQALFAFTTSPDAWSELGLRWYGAYRSRQRARDAFDSLVELLGHIGHLEPRSKLPARPLLRGSRLVALRRIGRDQLESAERFLAGHSRAFLQELSEALIERRGARREAALVQEDLQLLDAFYRSDLVKLREALRNAGRGGSFVPGDERDALFIAARDA